MEMGKVGDQNTDWNSHEACKVGGQLHRMGQYNLDRSRNGDPRQTRSGRMRGKVSRARPEFMPLSKRIINESQDQQRRIKTVLYG